MTYSSSVAMSRRRYVRQRQNIVSFQEKARTIGPVTNTIVLIVLACLVGLLYLSQVTKTNSYGYRIDQLQTQSKQLEDEKVDLQVTSARLQSLDRVKNSAVAKNLVNAPQTIPLNN